MQLDNMNDTLTEQLAAPTTRRTIVKTGVKLGYAIPLVAASYKLTGRGALAACGGDTPIAFDFDFTDIGTVSLCCGCCDIGDVGPNQGTLFDAFAECQALLAAQGTQCPLPGQPGDDITRVCLSFDLGSLIVSCSPSRPGRLHRRPGRGAWTAVASPPPSACHLRKMSRRHSCQDQPAYDGSRERSTDCPTGPRGCAVILGPFFLLPEVCR